MFAAATMTAVLPSCTNLDEITYDRIDASAYYQDENSVKGAVASIYASAQSGFLEYFWYLNEFPADQVTWRTWNGGAWGYDEAAKFVLVADVELRIGDNTPGLGTCLGDHRSLQHSPRRP